jgi:hypothetical protein
MSATRSPVGKKDVGDLFLKSHVTTVEQKATMQETAQQSQSRKMHCMHVASQKAPTLKSRLPT